MAFEKTSTANNVEPFARTQAAPVTTGQNSRRNPADAYVNISVRTTDDAHAKVGAISLNADKPLDKQILDHIVDSVDEGTPIEEVMAQLAGRLVLDFKRADGNNGKKLDLG